MKKISIILLVTILALINLSACTLETEYTHSNLIEQTKDMEKDIYSSIINNDGKKFKGVFCEHLQSGKEYSIRKIYNFFDGELVKLETDLDNDETYIDIGGGESKNGDFYKCFSFKFMIITDENTRYEIIGTGHIVDTIEPQNQGLHELLIYKQNEDGTWDYDNGLDIGRADY